jgi:hypothetical protein
MVAAAVLASLWAQAEPAPEPPPSAQPAPATPAAAGPSPAGQRNVFGLWGMFAYRTGKEADSLGPAAGFSIGGSFERRYLRRGEAPAIELAAGAEFFHDQFATDVTGSGPDPSGNEQTYPATRTITTTSFAAIQSVALDLAAIRFAAAVGAGIAIGYLSTPELELRPGSTSAVQPLARGPLAIELPLPRSMAVVVRGDYTHTFTRPTFTTDGGQTYSFLGDVITAGAGLKLRF